VIDLMRDKPSNGTLEHGDANRTINVLVLDLDRSGPRY